MLPRWHIFWGLIFTLIIWLFAPNISWINLSLIFFASFLMDIDHYLIAVFKHKKVSLPHALKFYREKRDFILKNKDKKQKEDFHLFHTIEFHLLIGIVGIFFTPSFYIFIGMVFHTLLDVIYMLYHDIFFVREYFFFNWARNLFLK